MQEEQHIDGISDNPGIMEASLSTTAQQNIKPLKQRQSILKKIILGIALILIICIIAYIVIVKVIH